MFTHYILFIYLGSFHRCQYSMNKKKVPVNTMVASFYFSIYFHYVYTAPWFHELLNTQSKALSMTLMYKREKFCGEMWKIEVANQMTEIIEEQDFE